MRNLALSLMGSAFVVATAGTVTAQVGPPAPNAFWVDGELYRTVATPTALPDRGPKDGIFVFTGLGGQIPVAEAKPGDKDYNGGRWVVYVLAFSGEGMMLHDVDEDGIVDTQLTSWEEAVYGIALGRLEIVGMGPSFVCPVIEPLSTRNGDEATAVSGARLLSEGGPEKDTGVVTANGWYEGEEIYYILGGVEEGVTERGQNDLYLIGGDRVYQANVTEFIPGEPGYSPHWNVNMVQTAEGVTLADILASPYASSHYPEALFDDAENILAAADAGLVTIGKPGTVVLCPVISEEGAEAPGNTELPEVFAPFPDTF